MRTPEEDAAALRRGVRNGLLLSVLFIYAPLAAIVWACIALYHQIF